MTNIIIVAKDEIRKLKENTPQGAHIRTGDIRKLLAKLYKNISDKSIENVINICTAFLEELSWEMGVIAFDWAYRVRKFYSDTTYDIFYNWLKKYVRGWGDCDDFCTHAFGELLRQEKVLFSKIVE